MRYQDIILTVKSHGYYTKTNTVMKLWRRIQMTNIKCDTCDRMLKEDELPENRDKNRIPIPFMPEPKERECFICFVERADFDGPNNFFPGHEKDEDSYHETLADFKKVRDN